MERDQLLTEETSTLGVNDNLASFDLFQPVKVDRQAVEKKKQLQVILGTAKQGNKQYGKYVKSTNINYGSLFLASAPPHLVQRIGYLNILTEYAHLQAKASPAFPQKNYKHQYNTTLPLIKFLRQLERKLIKKHFYKFLNCFDSRINESIQKRQTDFEQSFDDCEESCDLSAINDNDNLFTLQRCQALHNNNLNEHSEQENDSDEQQEVQVLNRKSQGLSESFLQTQKMQELEGTVHYQISGITQSVNEQSLSTTFSSLFQMLIQTRHCLQQFLQIFNVLHLLKFKLYYRKLIFKTKIMPSYLVHLNRLKVHLNQIESEKVNDLVQELIGIFTYDYNKMVEQQRKTVSEANKRILTPLNDETSNNAKIMMLKRRVQRNISYDLTSEDIIDINDQTTFDQQIKLLSSISLGGKPSLINSNRSSIDQYEQLQVKQLKHNLSLKQQSQNQMIIPTYRSQDPLSQSRSQRSKTQTSIQMLSQTLGDPDSHGDDDYLNNYKSYGVGSQFSFIQSQNNGRARKPIFNSFSDTDQIMNRKRNVSLRKYNV